MTMGINDRITRDDGQPASPDDYIDEAVVSDCVAHVEMMDDRSAFMLLGDFAFWIFVEWRWFRRPVLRIRYSEHRPPMDMSPCDRAERGCVLRNGHTGNCIEP